MGFRRSPKQQPNKNSKKQNIKTTSPHTPKTNNTKNTPPKTHIHPNINITPPINKQQIQKEATHPAKQNYKTNKHILFLEKS